MKKTYPLFILYFSIFLTTTLKAQVTSSDSLSLVSLYNNTSGANWSDNSGWLTLPVNQWYGVTVTNNRVTELYLANNNLSGTLPAEIGNLSALEVVYFSSNNISGPIPVQIGNLTSAQVLVLNQNQFSGSIPAEIGNLTNLMVLDLSQNQFTGAVPASFNNLTGLISLSLNNNLLTDLPVLTDLWPDDLKVENNRLTFEDIEPNLNVALVSFTYSPQDSIGVNLAIEQALGSPVTFSVSTGGQNNSYQWYHNGEEILGANGPEYTINSITQNDYGSYTVAVTNSTATDLTLWHRTIVLADGTLTARSNSLSENLSIAPNPVTDILFIKKSQNEATIRVLTLSGEEKLRFYSNNVENSIDLSDLERGAYILQIETRKENIIKRIIKQ